MMERLVTKLSANRTTKVAGKTGITGVAYEPSFWMAFLLLPLKGIDHMPYILEKEIIYNT